MSIYPEGWWKLSTKKRWIIESVRSGESRDEADAIRRWNKYKKIQREYRKNPPPKPPWLIISEEWKKVGDDRYPHCKDLWLIVDGIINTDINHPGWLALGIEAGLNILQQGERLKRAEISHKTRKYELGEYISAAIKKNDWGILGRVDEMLSFAKTLKPHHMYRAF